MQYSSEVSLSIVVLYKSYYRSIFTGGVTTMKEIVERLHESRQVELAKSILESAGYTVEKLEQSTKGYEWHKEPNKYRDSNLDPEYFMYYEPADIKDRRRVTYGQVYYPDKYDGYSAEIVKYPKAVDKKYCKSEEEAIRFIENWFSEKIKQSTEVNEDVETRRS